MVPAPENIKTDHPVSPRLGMEPHNFPACPEMVWTDINQHLDIYAGHSPQDAYTETLQDSVEASLPFFHLDKRIYSLIHPDKKQGYELSEHST